MMKRGSVVCCTVWLLPWTVLDDENLIYCLESNGDGGVQVKLYFPFRYIPPPNYNSPLNGTKLFMFCP